MTRPSSADATRVLSQAAQGDADAAAELLPLVYHELRKLAASYLRGGRPDPTLQPTALVHEAYLRLVDQSRVDWKGRTHFFAVAATEMRRVLIDYARARGRKKRGGGWARVSLDQAILPAQGGNIDALDLEDALDKLSAVHLRQSKIAELRYFSGLTVEEVAEALAVSSKTVEKDWRMARAWLYRHLKQGRES